MHRGTFVHVGRLLVLWVKIKHPEHIAVSKTAA